MDENRDQDKIYEIYPVKGRKAVTKEVIKNSFIAEGLTLSEISERYNISLDRIKELAKVEKWIHLRKSYISKGLNELQQKQIHQTQNVLDIERNFKQLRILQLEAQMQDYAAYFARHGDLKKRDPDTGEILKDSNGMDIMIRIPNVTKEIKDLKESLTASSGLQIMIDQIRDIKELENSEEKEVNQDKPDIEVDYLFQPKLEK